MSRRPIRDMAASVKQRLLNLARERGEEFNFVLSRFVVERFLFRLSCSEYRENFVLKGAMLFNLRSAEMPHRSTRDLDLLAEGSPDIPPMVGVFRRVCQTPVPDDGLVFLDDQVRGERIRDEDEYLGVRLHLAAQMGQARIAIQVDVGFGDAVTPPPEQEHLRTMLDFPSPVLLVYPWETVVAEKLHAIVELGMDNSRMKDYFDLDQLAKTKSFEGGRLAQAIQATFKRRRTPIPPETPVGLQSTFGEDVLKQTQWQAFLRRLHVEEGAPSLIAVTASLRVFLLPVLAGLDLRGSFDASWSPGGPWRPK